MRIIILEDEKGAAENLKMVLKAVSFPIEILAILESVADTIAWLSSHSMPDLGFFDIRLADGLSFSLFEETPINFPVVFTTAYTSYAIKAFKVNGLDYILKPVEQDAVELALEKYQRTQQLQLPKQEALRHIIEQFQQPIYRQNFLVQYRDKLLPVHTNVIAYFFIKDKITHLITLNNRTYNVEETLDQLENQLDPKLFFRANRQFLVAKSAVQSIDFFFNYRLSLNLHPISPERVLISKLKVPSFKSWMNL